MNINQHNYEVFFILYWDNELTADQKKFVEKFVEENKDLQEDFHLFGKSRFSPDMNLHFHEKDLLLNTENSAINFSNYTEQLLSYVDNELSLEQKKDFELFAEKHPAIKKELSLFQKTKLQPDADVLFPDKSSLYRREEKVRVIKLSFMRVAVAAALILVAGLVSISVINNNSKGEIPEIVLTNPAVNPLVSGPLVQEKPVNDIVSGNTETINTASIHAKDKPAILPKENQAAENIIALNPDNNNNLPKERAIADRALIAQNTAVTPSNPLVVLEKDDHAVALSKQITKKDIFENSTVTDRPVPSYANYEVSDELKKDIDNGGLKGLLRKATRLFERRTNIQTTSEDDKLLVGIFAVSLK